MNHWCGSGNVSTDVQIRYTTTGTPVAKFNLAIRDTFKKDAATTFIQVNVWDKLAEACVNNVYTGDKIVVEGKLKYNGPLVKTTKKISKRVLIQ